MHSPKPKGILNLQLWFRICTNYKHFRKPCSVKEIEREYTYIYKVV